MPIYEFYCPVCHTVFCFLARTPDTSRRPDCPRCGLKRLERRPSVFAAPRGLDEGGSERDDARLESALSQLLPEAEAAGEDPVAGAALVRKLYRTAGLPLDGPTEEALRRLEAGDDPASVEGDLDAAPRPPSRAARAARTPRVDPELRDL